MPAHSVQDLAELVDGRLRQLDLSSPGIKPLARLFEVLFFVTLKTEEGKPLQLRVVLVDPKNPDPDRPPHPRPDRWKITNLKTDLPFTSPTLIKLAKAADPWNSSLAAYYKDDGSLFVWGMVDQAVHFNTRLVRESESGYALPGVFQVLAAGPADLSVFAGFRFMARLQQDAVLKNQTDIFWSGPISNCLDLAMQRYLQGVWVKCGHQKSGAMQSRIWLTSGLARSAGFLSAYSGIVMVARYL